MGSVPLVEHQEHMAKHLKNIARHAQEMVEKSNTKPKELGGTFKAMVKDYNMIFEDMQNLQCTKV